MCCEDTHPYKVKKMKKSYVFIAIVAVLAIQLSVSGAAASGNPKAQSNYYAGKYAISGFELGADVVVINDQEYPIPFVRAAEVNGHSGFKVHVVADGVIDAPLIFCLGYENAYNPQSALQYIQLAGYTMGSGKDLMIFDSLDPSMSLYNNAENLAAFVGDVLPMFGVTEETPIICGGKSAGGLYTRIMFVQENDDMGIDTYFSVDTPHTGVVFSNWAMQLGIPYAFFTGEGAFQMMPTDPRYILDDVAAQEKGYFLNQVIDDVEKIAFTAVNNDDNEWAVDDLTMAYHGVYFPVSSWQDTTFLQEMGYPVPDKTGFIPYHSSAYLMTDEVELKDNGMWHYKANAQSKYFDQIVAPPTPDIALSHDDMYLFNAGYYGLVFGTLVA